MDNTPESHPHDTLLRARAVDVTRYSGETLTVTVRQIRVREIPRWLALEADELKRLQLVTGLTDADLDGTEANGHLDALEPESVEALLAADMELNDPLAQRRAQRDFARQMKQMDQMKRAMPALYQQVEAEVKDTLRAAMVSAASSPAS